MSATVVVATHLGGARLERLLDSLAAQTLQARTIVVDNASPGGVAALVAPHEFAEQLRLEENVGFGRAVNLAAARTEDDALVLVNDDCVCEPRFVEEVTAALDPAAGVVMAAGVLVEAHDPATIDTAGMELDATLLVFDYLNGEPVESLSAATPPPIGPCGAAAAFDRAAFAAAPGSARATSCAMERARLSAPRGARAGAGRDPLRGTGALRPHSRRCPRTARRLRRGGPSRASALPRGGVAAAAETSSPLTSASGAALASGLDASRRLSTIGPCGRS
jgi:hypothetical protein